jgi:uncharacterized protein YecE (DUF72 family)
VEVRHRSWQRREVREFFKETGFDFCNIDQPLVSYPMGRTAWVTGPRGYLRAHGRGRETWFQFGEDRHARYDYLYSPEELEDLAARTRELMGQARDVYVVFNNHPAGQAVANALEMAHRLTGRTFTLPSCLVQAFPRLGQAAG